MRHGRQPPWADEPPEPDWHKLWQEREDPECVRCGTSPSREPEGSPTVYGKFDYDSDLVKELRHFHDVEPDDNGRVVLCDGCHIMLEEALR